MRFLFLATACLLACSSDPETSTPTTDSAVSDTENDTAITDTGTMMSDAKTETAPLGAGCNTVMNKATAITQTKGTGSPPSFMGGSVSDGIYAMTKWEIFGNTPSTTPITETLIVKGSKWEMVAQSGTITARSNFDVTLGFTDITLTPTCPAGSKAQTSPYTATPTKIVSGKTDGSELVTFTKL